LAASYRDAGEQPQRDSALKKLALISTENAKLKVAVRTLDIESIADNGDTGRATSEARDFDRSIAAKYGATSEVAQMSGALYLKYLTMSFGRDEALAIANERLGQALDDDRSVQEWSLLVERARILTDLKRFAEAEADLRSVERIAIRLFGTESRQHAVALYQYARYFKVLGDSERELELTLRYVKILDRLYPEGYGMQAGLRNNLAAVYARLGRSKEALALSAEAVELGRKAFGDEHVNMLTFQSNHAKALFQNNQLEQADGLYRKVLARRYELSEGKLTGPVLELSLRYMQLLKAMGRSQEWQKLRAQLLQGIETDVAIPDQAEARRRVELSEQESGTQP
jgi:tetratricopeptide (TPR) repeat protein